MKFMGKASTSVEEERNNIQSHIANHSEHHRFNAEPRGEHHAH
jgi:hypothetical protein